MGFHKFLNDGDGCLTCLVCGGVWTDVDGDPEAANGDPVARCSGDTGQCHGAGDEHGHLDGECVRHDCNCLFCV